MGYKLVSSSPRFRDIQDELPLAICPECLKEIYVGELFTAFGAAFYHEQCYERMEKNGDSRYLPSGKR